MRRGYRERFPRHWLQRKPLVNDPGMHHGTCVTHVSWCMSGSLTSSGGENAPSIPGACTTRNFTYLARGPCSNASPHSLTVIGTKASSDRYEIWRMARQLCLVACAKYGSDMLPYNGVALKLNFHRIWKTMRKSFVKWVPSSTYIQSRYLKC